ncbi:MAG TPA: Cj0069 family protein [Chitinophagaceae bacterium]|nr:Cj0069 family protein [Chitinophagaceae bacterium]
MSSIALMIYGDVHSNRNALTEEKYKDLASAFSSQGFNTESVLYNDGAAGKLAIELLKFDAVLVWVNPIEQGNNREKLDALLGEIATKGCFVSTHPEVILKMGTKDVLYKTKDMDWGGDTKMYTSYQDFLTRFYSSLKKSRIRVLKQYRGNGGNGVYKVVYNSANEVKLTHAMTGSVERNLVLTDFYKEFEPFFLNDGLLIDQEWNKNIANGMVRCYLTGRKVSGYGFQEINALYETNDKTHISPSKRYYFTENCGLFSDLKELMQNEWVPQLQKSLLISESKLPVIWDADFFINKPNSKKAGKKYTLCEINVSCVSPFPPSAIKFMVDEVKTRIKNKTH